MKKKEKLLQLIDHYANGNKAEFARMIRISPQGLSAWVSRNTYDVEVLNKGLPDVSLNFLVKEECTTMFDPTPVEGNEEITALCNDMREFLNEVIVNRQNELRKMQALRDRLEMLY